MRGVMMAAVMAIGVMVGAVAAQDAADIRHPPARRALARAEQETRKAEQAYRQALLAIQRDLVRELEQAKSDAMQRQLLDQANAIQAAIDAARGELDRLEGKPVVQTFTIDATKPWQPTIEVRKGQRVEVKARGEWNGATHLGNRGLSGPDGIKHPRDGYHTYYLHGRIGGGEPIKIGSGARFVADADGMLEMEMRDGSHDNNSGSITVQISVQ